MSVRLKVAACFLTATLPVAAASFDENKPYGRATVAVVDGNGKQEPLTSSSAAGAGKSIKVYLDASEKCSAVVAAFRNDGKVVSNWRPEVVELNEEFEETQVPKTPTTWSWTTGSEPFEVRVVFMAPGSKELEECKRLVAAMQNANLDERVLSMQANKLREILSRAVVAKNRSQQGAPDSEVGGVFRGTAFPWREYAQGANFSPDQAGSLVFSSNATSATALKP